jgi:hypothetical protein
MLSPSVQAAIQEAALREEAMQEAEMREAATHELAMQEAEAHSIEYHRQSPVTRILILFCVVLQVFPYLLVPCLCQCLPVLGVVSGFC